MFRIIILIYCILSCSLNADELLNSLDISRSAIQAQSKRLEVVSQNLANIQSTGTVPGELPYRRKVIYMKEKKRSGKKLGGVKVRRIAKDTKTDFIKSYDPTHPAADNRGYVLKPNIDRFIELMDAKEAQMLFEANLNVSELTNNMIDKIIQSIN